MILYVDSRKVGKGRVGRTQLATERARLAFVGIAAAALAPMLPLLFTAFSLEDLIHQAIKRLLGV